MIWTPSVVLAVDTGYCTGAATPGHPDRCHPVIFSLVHRPFIIGQYKFSCLFIFTLFSQSAHFVLCFRWQLSNILMSDLFGECGTLHYSCGWLGGGGQVGPPRQAGPAQAPRRAPATHLHPAPGRAGPQPQPGWRSKTLETGRQFQTFKNFCWRCRIAAEIMNEAWLVAGVVCSPAQCECGGMCDWGVSSLPSCELHCLASVSRARPDQARPAETDRPGQASRARQI